ncbi:unnamed protein product [Arctogadus glacialis]
MASPRRYGHPARAIADVMQRLQAERPSELRRSGLTELGSQVVRKPGSNMAAPVVASELAVCVREERDCVTGRSRGKKRENNNPHVLVFISDSTAPHLFPALHGGVRGPTMACGDVRGRQKASAISRLGDTSGCSCLFSSQGVSERERECGHTALRRDWLNQEAETPVPGQSVHC